MTYSLTAAQLTRLQRKLAITNDQSVFTDAELNDMFDEAVGDFTRAIVLAIRDLLMDAAKFVNYTEGQTSEERSERFKQAQQMLGYYEDAVLNGEQQFAIVGMRPVPTRLKDVPYDGAFPRRRRYPYGLY